MKLAELVEQDSGTILTQKKLVVDDGITSLEGIERFQNLEEIVIDDLTVGGLELLDSPNLYGTVKSLSFMPYRRLSLPQVLKLKKKGFKHLDLSFLAKFRALERLEFGDDNILGRYFIKLHATLCTLPLRRLRSLVLPELSSEELPDLAFLSDYGQLEKFGCRDIPPVALEQPRPAPQDYFAFLNSEKLKSRLKDLELSGINVPHDLRFLEGYQQLERLCCSGRLREPTWLTAKSMHSTLKELEIELGPGSYLDDPGKQFEYLGDFTNLETIHLDFSNYTFNGKLSFLESENIKRTLRKLHINGLLNGEVLSHLADYSLNHLDFSSSTGDFFSGGIEDFSFLQSDHLKNSLRVLRIEAGGEALRPELHHLRDCALEELELWNWPLSDDDLSFLVSERLKETLQRLNLVKTEFRDISLLKDYQVINKLVLSKTNVTSITDLLDYQFVKNGALRRISLPESIHWEDIRNGAVVLELRKQGVDVDLPLNFFYDSEPEFPPQVYIICGPSAAGKSTLINNLIRKYTGVQCIPEITNRPQRVGEENDPSIEHISTEEFNYLRGEGALAISRKYRGYDYGVRLSDLLKAGELSQAYLLNWGGPEDALQLRSALSQNGLQNLVKVVLLLPTKELVGRGFAERLVTNPSGQVALDTKERLNELTVNFDRISSYVTKGVDALILSESYERVEERMIDLIKNGRKLVIS